MKKRTKKNGKHRKGVSRREFIKQSASAGTATVAGLAAMQSSSSAFTTSPDVPPRDVPSSPSLLAQTDEEPTVDRRAILFAIGDTLIPSAPGDPGYKDLEWHGISAEVERRMEGVTDDDLKLFNDSSVTGFGKKFTELSEVDRASYFNRIIMPDGFADKPLQDKLRAVYSNTREAVFLTYYQNYPQDRWPFDGKRVPLLKPGDTHQITNPNTPAIPTGWDLSGYAGPLTLEEEERRRNFFKKIRWQE
jgi:hypothetical protein